MLRNEHGAFVDTKLDDAKRYQIIRMYAAGVLIKVIAHKFDVSSTHIQKIAKRVGLHRNKTAGLLPKRRRYP